ncbi:hypothetical protein [Arthrobacter sp. SDTb3-6]|uniref:hypothetical protein n=1 Tax=Arthrobacter sp. SDTb3-6 TaxID=2713571 RepID=UPI00159EAB94|nr:hypothetical protein [Arthrobacter sp. SDTb3-6]NVM97766.1 hypothetical protein [Arthrobacter sp. SDTb3-6]
MVRRKTVWGACLAGAGLLAGMAWGGVAPAAAVPGDEGAAVDVVEPGRAPVVLKAGPDGKSYWELTVEGGGAYIASWERSSGLWGSAGEAAAALKGMYDCRNNAVLKYASRFATYGAFNRAAGTKHGAGTGLSFTDPATVKAFAACMKDSHISSDQVKSVRAKAGKGKPAAAQVIQIPAALTGPGTHELFIARYSLLALGNPMCPRMTWGSSPGVEGGTITGRCNPSLKDLKTFTVTIPREASDTVLGGPVVEPGSWFEPSSYSNFRAFTAPATGSSAPFPAGLWALAWPILLLGMVVALLLAGSTSLLAAGAGPGTGRLAAAVRRVVPTVGRDFGRAAGRGISLGARPGFTRAAGARGVPAAEPGVGTGAAPGADLAAAEAEAGAAAPGAADATTRRDWRVPVLGQVHGPLAFLILLACAALAAAGQEGFAWSQGAARMAFSFLAAFLLLNHGSMVVRWTVVRRHGRGFFPRVAARPVYVAVLLASLAFTRVAGPEPALVFGAVLGVDYSLNTKDAGHRRLAVAAIAGSVYMAVVGLAAWAGYSFLAANDVGSFIKWDEIQPDYVAAVSDAGGFTTLAAGELLAIVAVLALAALPVTLLPLAPFEGALVWAWNRGVWILCYIAAVALFSFVLLPWPRDGLTVPLAARAGLYAAYAVVAGAVCAVMAIGRRRQREGVAPAVAAPRQVGTPTGSAAAGDRG